MRSLTLLSFLFLLFVSCGGHDQKPALGLSYKLSNNSENADQQLSSVFEYNSESRTYDSRESIDEYNITIQTKTLVATSLDIHTKNLKDAKQQRNSGDWSGEKDAFTQFVYTTEHKVEALNKVYELVSFIADNKIILSDLNFEIDKLLEEYAFEVKFAYHFGAHFTGYDDIEATTYLNNSNVGVIDTEKRLVFMQQLNSPLNMHQVLENLYIDNTRRSSDKLLEAIDKLENNSSLQSLFDRFERQTYPAVEKYRTLIKAYKEMRQYIDMELLEKN